VFRGAFGDIVIRLQLRERGTLAGRWPKRISVQINAEGIVHRDSLQFVLPTVALSMWPLTTKSPRKTCVRVHLHFLGRDFSRAEGIDQLRTCP